MCFGFEVAKTYKSVANPLVVDENATTLQESLRRSGCVYVCLWMCNHTLVSYPTEVKVRNVLSEVFEVSDHRRATLKFPTWNLVASMFEVSR